MLKKLLVTTAISGFMISGAFAQSVMQKSQDQAPNAPPITKSDNVTPNMMPPKNESAAPSKMDGGKFVNMQSSDQWVFSKFKGTDVIGPDDATIGSVNDLLFDKNGKVIAVVVGVGGFLGIGEKNVAIDLAAFQPVSASTSGDATRRALTTADDPSQVKLKVSWTKDQLKDAPDFQYFKVASKSSSGLEPNARPGTATR